MHNCEIKSPYTSYGPAIDYCTEIDGYFWFGNGEYSTMVNFCPKCGLKAPNPIIKEKEYDIMIDYEFIDEEIDEPTELEPDIDLSDCGITLLSEKDYEND